MADIYDEEDRRRALTQGLLGAGLAMLGARKGSEYNAFAQAGLLGLGGFNRSLEGSTEARDRKAQRDLQGQQWAMTKAEHELKLKALQDAQAQKQRLGGVYADMPVGMPTAGVAPATAAQFGPGGGDTTGLSGMPPAPVTQPSPFDQYIAKARYFEQAARKFPQDAEMLMAQAEKQYAAAKDWRDQNEGPIEYHRVNGKMVGVQRKKYGNPQEFDGYQPKPHWSMQDTGGSIQPVDLSGATTPQVMPKTMTYGDKAAFGNLDVSRQRLAFDKSKEGEGAKPPPGYQWNANRSALAPIPGGPHDTSKIDDAKATQAIDEAEIAIGKIKEAKKMVGWMTTGARSESLGRIPGMEAYDLRATVETIKSNLGLSELQRMRDNSKTGGAMGNLTDRELMVLSAKVANLDPNQSAGQLSKNLDEVLTYYEALKQTSMGRRKQMGGTGGWSATEK